MREVREDLRTVAPSKPRDDRDGWSFVLAGLGGALDMEVSQTVLDPVHWAVRELVEGASDA